MIIKMNSNNNKPPSLPSCSARDVPYAWRADNASMSNERPSLNNDPPTPSNVTSSTVLR